MRSMNYDRSKSSESLSVKLNEEIHDYDWLNPHMRTHFRNRLDNLELQKNVPLYNCLISSASSFQCFCCDVYLMSSLLPLSEHPRTMAPSDSRDKAPRGVELLLYICMHHFQQHFTSCVLTWESGYPTAPSGQKKWVETGQSLGYNPLGALKTNIFLDCKYYHTWS